MYKPSRYRRKKLLDRLFKVRKHRGCRICGDMLVYVGGKAGYLDAKTGKDHGAICYKQSPRLGKKGKNYGIVSLGKGKFQDAINLQGV